MLGAVPIQNAMAPPGQAQLKVPFGPVLCHNGLVSADQGGKGQKMTFFHRVGRGEIPLVLHRLCNQPVRFVRLLGAQGLQRSASAGYGGRTGGGEQIAALRADIKAEIAHTSSRCFLFLQPAG